MLLFTSHQALYNLWHHLDGFHKDKMLILVLFPAIPGCIHQNRVTGPFQKRNIILACPYYNSVIRRKTHSLLKELNLVLTGSEIAGIVHYLTAVG